MFLPNQSFRKNSKFLLKNLNFGKKSKLCKNIDQIWCPKNFIPEFILEKLT